MEYRRRTCLMRVLMGMPKKGLAGGPQGHLPFLVEGLRAHGVTVDELTYGSRTANPSLAGRVALVLKDARAFRASAAALKVDVIHLNTAFDVKALIRDVVTVSFVRPSFRGHIFLKFHGSDLCLAGSRNPLLRGLARYLFTQVDGVGVLSTEERQAFAERGFPQKKLHVVKNILRSEDFVKDPGFRAKMGIAEGTTILLFTGRMIAEKGLTDVVRALSIVSKSRSDFVLICLGDGPDRSRAESLASELSLTDHIRFLGYIPEAETATYYANASFLVFPTFHQEGFPMTVFRSVAAGIPVITTKIRAAADYLQEPVNCFWVEHSNPEQLAVKILLLMDRKDIVARMGEVNRTLADRFNARHVAQEFVDIYLRLSANRA
jgi:glycosyltransferase involved in cell wall biosynthesis